VGNVDNDKQRRDAQRNRKELGLAAESVRSALAGVRRMQRSRAWRMGAYLEGVARGRSARSDASLEAASGELAQLSRRLARWGRVGAPRRMRVAVTVWDMGHNAVGRPYYVADMLSREHDVELVGINFPHHGTSIWEPIRGAELSMRSMPGTDLPQLIDDAERFTRDLRPDLVYVSKARFPSLLLAMTIKRRSGVPVIIDVDESELSFVPSSEPISLAELEGRRDRRDYVRAWSDSWTAATASLVSAADAVLAGSEPLQRLYGGTWFPHVRDELTFDPSRYDRARLRSELGYGPEDRVFVFLGTPERHKGVLELLRALEAQPDERYRLCIVGSTEDEDLRSELMRSPSVQMIAPRPPSDVPALTMIGDLYCLLQDPAREISATQTPAKLTEALAMEVPVLAERTPPLRAFADAGLIHTLDGVPLAQRIRELMADRDSLRRPVKPAREFFLQRMSYAACLETLHRVMYELDFESRGLPSSWERAYELARQAGAGRSRSAMSWNVAYFAGSPSAVVPESLARADWARRVISFDEQGDRTGRLPFPKRDGKLRRYQFTARPSDDPSTLQRLLLPNSDDFLGFVAWAAAHNRLADHPLLLWVAPPEPDFHALRALLTPAFTVLDLTADHSDLAAGSTAFEPLAGSYRSLLDRSDLVLVSSEQVRGRLRRLGVRAEMPARVETIGQLLDQAAQSRSSAGASGSTH
jgi:glycosyltransferase involved in cell wall biosynthesis